MNEKTMHLFAGAGGGILADLILGKRPVIAVEWEKYACKVLRERAEDGWFPDLRVWEGDVRLFDPSEYAGVVDCIHAGFPCQDISNAGKQAGVGKETRSGLYREVLRIAGVVRPRELFLENVSAILRNGLGTVLGDLAALGYDARWCCIRASDVGANHKRDRWWLLARLADTKLLGCLHREPKVQSTERGVDALGHASASREYVADTKSVRVQGRRPSGEQESHAHAEQGLSMRSCERRGEPYWKTEPNVGRVANGVANRVDKLKAIGNGQVPLQAATAYKILERLFENVQKK